MIQPNEELHLGRKAYTFILLKKFIPGLIILAIAFVLLAIGDSVSGATGYVVKFIGFSATGAADTTAGYMSYVIMLAFILAGVSILMSFFSAQFEYRHYTFTFEEFDMRLKRGLMKQVVVSIPYRQMVDVGIERGAWHQMTGTSKVIINSAAQEQEDEKNETDIVLNPLDKDIAEEVRLLLQRKIGVQVVQTEREADKAFATSTHQ